jgi:hypothetical protein
MTSLKQIVDRHLEQMNAARRQRRLDDYQVIVAILSLPDSDGDGADGSYDYLDPEDWPAWRGTE